jgi:hypothetical protein
MTIKYQSRYSLTHTSQNKNQTEHIGCTFKFVVKVGVEE